MSVLVIPHRDFMFDKNRPVTMLKHFICDYYSDPVPTIEHYFEYAKLARCDKNYVEKGLERRKGSEDMHCHTFTPSSANELFKYLPNLGNNWASYDIHVPDNIQKLVEFYFVASK